MIIPRYLARELYAHLLAVTIILFVVFVTNQFVFYLKEVAKGHITLSVVGELMLLQAPLLLGFLLPLAFFLSILLVLGRLYVDHEITVLQACGVSQLRLLSIVASVSLIIFMLVTGLMLWLEPKMQAYRERVFDYAIAQATVAKIIPQQFEYFGNNRVFYAHDISRQRQQMKDVFFAIKGSDNQSWDIVIAKSALEQKNPQTGEQFLTFNKGYRYVGVPGKPKFEIAHFKQYGLEPLLPLGTIHIWPKDVPTWELWKKRHGSRAKSIAAELHWRIAMPISVLVLTLLAFAMCHVNPRLGKFTQLIPAILLYIIYGDLLFLGRAWVKKGQINAIIGLWWIHALMFVMAMGVMIYRWFGQRRG